MKTLIVHWASTNRDTYFKYDDYEFIGTDGVLRLTKRVPAKNVFEMDTILYEDVALVNLRKIKFIEFVEEEDEKENKKEEEDN